MSDYIKKDNLLEWLRTHKNIYTVTWNNNLNADVIDRSAVRIELMEYITKEINSGTLDAEQMEYEKAYWAREGLINKQLQKINSINSSLELAVKALEEIETHIADFTVQGYAEHYHNAYIEVKKLAHSILEQIRREQEHEQVRSKENQS